jgi:CheY-like chemotaxis protein
MLMGGDVGVDSKEGQGSIFWFRIRVTLVEPQEESRQTLRVSINPAMTGLLHGRRILVVEDNLTNQVVVKALLERQGVSVVCVGDGQAALHALEAGHGFDAVLMDCQMPVMDGFTATAKLREREAAAAHPRLPIIALTAGAFEDDRKACLAAGMDDYLAKPIKLDDLITTLGRWLHA